MSRAMNERYFLDELAKFWTLTGELSFWESEEKAEAAFGAICHLAFTTPGLSEGARTSWRAAVENYTRRKVYMDCRPRQLS